MARKLSRKRRGEPVVKTRSQSFGALRQFNNPIFKKRRVRTLIKVQESKGVTQPQEAHNVTSAKGVDTGRGFATSAKVMLQKPFVRPPFTTRPGKTVSKAPTINSGKVRNRKQGP